MTRRLVFLAVALVAISNAIVLSGVAWNRGGEPEAALELTQRELIHPWSYDRENSGVALNLHVNSPYGGDAVGAIPPESLRDIGFDPDGPIVLQRAGDPNSGYLKTTSRKTLAVLELDGEGWKKWLSEWASSEHRWPADPNTQSRLFVVDVGLDGTALRSRYPDRHRYAIVNAQVWLYPWHINAGLRGSAMPLIEDLHVPRQFHQQLGLPEDPDATGTRSFTVLVQFGRRLEPWVASINPDRPASGEKPRP